MWWRLKRSEYERSKGEGNRQALRAIVTAGEVPGLLGYRGGRPVGWCSLGPRERFPVLDRSRTLRRVDEAPVWSLVCFFVARQDRGRGVAAALLEGAIDHARRAGCTLLEAYPLAPLAGRVPAAFAWTGLLSLFLRAGFREVARRSPTRPVVRLSL
jgi:GNAT superfamily N-acetyltransferase